MTKRGLIPTQLPTWLAQLCQTLHHRLGGQFFTKPPSHVLINSYAPGQGIMPHVDGPSYQPTVGILSLGAPVVFRFYHAAPSGPADHHSADGNPCPTAQETPSTSCHESASEMDLLRASFAVVLPRRSLLLFRGEKYAAYRHGISATATEVVDSSVLNRDEPYVQALRHVRPRAGLDDAGPKQQPCGAPCGQPQLGAACAQDTGVTHMAAHKVGHDDAAGGSLQEDWAFARGGERISLTFRNATRELTAFSLLRRQS